MSNELTWFECGDGNMPDYACPTSAEPRERWVCMNCGYPVTEMAGEQCDRCPTCGKGFKE